MELLGTTKEEFEQILRLILERRRVSHDLLKAHLGSSARAANMMSVLEMNRFITKPLGSALWNIDFIKMEQFLEDPSSLEDDPLEDDTSDIIATSLTIKGGGLPTILKGLYLADYKFNIAKILTTDLTTEEIDTSLESIEQAKIKYKDFVRQYNTLEAKIKALEDPIQDMEEKGKSLKDNISSSGSAPFIVAYVFGIITLLVVGGYMKMEGIFPLSVILCGTILIALIGLVFLTTLINKENRNLFQLQAEKKDIENAIRGLRDDRKNMDREKKYLAKSYGLTRDANPVVVNACGNRIVELEDVLKKMKSVLMDHQESQSKKLLALEQLIYIVDKKYNDSLILEEQRKATDYAREQVEYAKEQAEEARRQTEATRNVEEAIRKQTEFQAYVELMKDIKRENR